MNFARDIKGTKVILRIVQLHWVLAISVALALRFGAAKLLISRVKISSQFILFAKISSAEQLTMKTNKGNNNQEEEEAYEEDFSSRKEGTSTNHKDGKNNDKANAIRSKHSVTEQRRRSKINERFQILRELIPHGDQKRDTASFLLEVIEYVQLLQERVQKHEGPCQGWSAEPTKLMPWRHSHWRVQSLLGHPQVVKNNCGLGTPFPGKLDEKSVSINPIVAANLQNPMEPAPSEDNFRVTDSESFEKAATSSSPFQIHTPTSVHNEAVPAYSTQRPVIDGLSSDSLVSSNSQQDEHIIEGGTISISSTYSHELLTTLTQALQNSGVDLSKASISIQIDLGKRANQSRVAGTSGIEEHSTPATCSLAMAHHTDGSADEDLDQAQKRLKT